MVEQVSTFPLQKLRPFKYLSLEVMMHTEYQEAQKFMFSINKEGRSFLKNDFIIIRNGFINDGLITYILENDFNGSMLLE